MNITKIGYVGTSMQKFDKLYNILDSQDKISFTEREMSDGHGNELEIEIIKESIILLYKQKIISKKDIIEINKEMVDYFLVFIEY